VFDVQSARGTVGSVEGTHVDGRYDDRRNAQPSDEMWGHRSHRHAS
jgi:hypothetical protein